MATKVEKSSSSDNAPLYDMVLNLVQHHLTFKNYTIDDKVSSLSESQKLDVKVNKIMKILIDSDS